MHTPPQTGYIMSGYTNSNDGDVSGYHGGSGNEDDAWVVKLSSSGDVQWQKPIPTMAMHVTITEAVMPGYKIKTVMLC